MILYVAIFCAVVVLWRRLRTSRFSLDKVPGPPRASFLLGMFFNPVSRTEQHAVSPVAGIRTYVLGGCMKESTYPTYQAGSSYLPSSLMI